MISLIQAMKNKNPKKVIEDFQAFRATKRTRSHCDLEIFMAWDTISILLLRGASKRSIWQFLKSKQQFSGTYQTFLSNFKKVSVKVLETQDRQTKTDSDESQKLDPKKVEANKLLKTFFG